MAYTRRPPGKEYLKAVLADKINSLIEHKDLELEINPSKVYETLLSQETEAERNSAEALPRGITGDEAAARADVQEIIEPRVQGLIGVANSFLGTIIAGLEEIPYGIRWICKQIRSLSRRKYPDASNETICTLIGGFFFLRFINPAIISPASYMVIDSTPAENPRRTLTYVAKMLQNLANKPTTSKEDYMTAVLQPFTQQNRERMSAFLLEICEVQDFYESLELDNYVALSKKDLELKITLNEVYSMHEMLQEHEQQLVSQSKTPRLITNILLGKRRKSPSRHTPSRTRSTTRSTPSQRQSRNHPSPLLQVGNAPRRPLRRPRHHPRRSPLHGSKIHFRPNHALPSHRLSRPSETPAADKCCAGSRGNEK